MRNFYKRSKLKISLSPIVICRGGRPGTRELVPLYTRPPRIAGISNCPPSPWLGPNLDLEKLVSLVTERSCNKLAFLLVGFFFFPFWQASESTLLLKKGYLGKCTNTKVAGLQIRPAEGTLQFGTGAPKSRPQVQGIIGECLYHTVLTYWGQTKHGPKRALPILCHPCPHPFCVYVYEDHDI